MDTKALKPLPPKLPEKIDDWERKVKFERSLNDQVEDIHRRLVDEGEEYRGYLYAVWDEQAVEGSLAADNFKAAEMIRAQAQNSPGYEEVGRQKLATLVKVLGVVLRRYGASRKDRRNMVGGEVVGNDNGE
jgi:hypothetical protein